MECQVCGNEAGKVCGACGVGFYCSAECQSADRPKHKAICGLWKKKGPTDAIVNNPWYTPKDTVPEVRVAPQCDDDHPLLKACRSGKAFSIEMADEIPGTKDKPAHGKRFVAMRMGWHGETPLHFAVAGGNLEGVKLLLASGAFVDFADSRDNTPLYYACTHPGIEGRLTPAVRLAIVKELVRAGANVYAKGGYSGKRPIEAALANNHHEAAQYISESPEAAVHARIREHFNAKEPPADIALGVRLNLEVMWRMRTIEWAMSPHGTNCIPHPQLRLETLVDVELALQECARRHAYWWTKLMPDNRTSADENGAQ